MRVTFFRREKTLKIISMVLAAGFLATSAYAEVDSRLRPTAAGNSGKKVDVLLKDLKGTRTDGGAFKSVIDDLRKNTGLPFEALIPAGAVSDSGVISWKEALKVLHFSDPIFRRVETDNEKNPGTDPVDLKILSNEFYAKNLKQYDIDSFPGGTRLVGDMKAVLIDPAVADEKAKEPAYYMHRGVFASQADVEKAFQGANKLRYDVTVIPAADWGNEPAKTFGHFHMPIEKPELYQVLSGEVMWLLQKTNDKEGLGEVTDFIAVKAKAGDIVIMLPGYGHVSVNISKTEPLIMADWLTWNQRSQYGSFDKNKGAAYYVVRNKNGKLAFVPNKAYSDKQKLPPVRQMTMRNIPEFGVVQGEGIYKLVNDPEFIKKTEYLLKPEKYPDILNPDKIFKDGGEVERVVATQPAVKIFAENVIVSDGKGADVGRALRLEKLIEEKLDGALLGHSNTRKTFIKEFSKGNSRDNAFLRFDQIMNHRILAELKAGIHEIPLCIGSDRDNLPVEEEIADVLKQLKVSLTGVTQEQLKEKIFDFAWEPAGNIGTGVAEGPEKIRIVHQAIYDFFVETYGQETIKAVWGKSLRLLYGASVDGKNVDGIMAVKSTKPGMEGVQLVHGVLFASSGKKVGGFLEVAYGVNRAAVRNNAQYVTFINLKEFLAKDKTPMVEYIGDIYQAIMAGGITPANNLLYITDQDVHLKKWQRAIRLAEEAAFDGGSAVSTIPGINTFGPEELSGLRVLLRLDLNVSDDTGKIKSEKRIKEAIDTIAYYIDNGATVIISSHNSRPKGKVNKKLSLGPNEETQDGVSLRIEKLLREKGYDAKVIFHPDSVTDKGVKPGLRNEIVEGAVNVIENVRFAKGEEKNYESFYKDMAALADYEHFDFDAFGAGERPDAVSSAKYMQSISQGLLMEKEDRYLKNALEVNYGLISGGGPKVSEKLPVLKNVIANKKKPGGFAMFGTAPDTFFLDALYGIKLGDSKSSDEKKIKSRQDNIEQAKEIVQLAKENKMDLVLPIDFIAVDRDLTEIADGENNWIALKEIPKGAKIYRVTLEQLKSGKFLDENNNEVLASDLFLYDIGEQTKKLFKEKILSTPKGMSIFYNGTVGVFEIPLFAEGGKAVDVALAEATRNGVITVIGGGDTGKEAEKNKVDKLVTHVSTGGGASAAVLKGEELSAIKLLNKAQASVKSRMENLGVSIKEFMQYLVADKAVFKAMGGEFYRKYIASLVKAQEIKSGDLANIKISAQIISDSRGKPTVRAIIKIGDIEVVGEVPAGASKGEDEAMTVSAEQAIKNINELILPLLTKSGLDLSRHEDLKQAEKLIMKAAGQNYKDIGANAVVPVSWALWRAAAKLHNMELWEYIRWYEAQLVGKGSVAFYANIFNGGLHALKAGEKLGVDRVEIQEMLAVILGDRPAAEKLQMTDRIDQELKKLLESEYMKELIGRADEAGFSVKGLGSSEKAIALVVQAIKNAGYEPGKDVQLALDVAATSFVREVEGKYVYDFQGKEMTGRQMIDFYIDLVKKYPGLIRSIEDGLAENDWDNWVILTAELKKFGILSIGDDLFVTQMERLKKGVEMKAASAILIKVNQNGSVSGTLEVIQYAMEHGLEIVVSHRSGETLDPAIADLAYAVKAMGLKTGAPQPAADFSDPNTLVRRVKYVRLKTIEENPYLSGKVLLVNENFFSSAASRTALSMVAELADSIKIAVYGKNAEKLKILLGSDNVVVADDFGKALASLENLGVAKENMLLLDSALSSQDVFAANSAGIRQVVAKDLSVVAVAKAIKELVKSEAANSRFSELFESVEGEKIVQASVETKQALLNNLAQGAFELPSDLKLTVSQDVAEDVLKAQASVSEFMTRV